MRCAMFDARIGGSVRTEDFEAIALDGGNTAAFSNGDEIGDLTWTSSSAGADIVDLQYEDPGPRLEYSPAGARVLEFEIEPAIGRGRGIRPG